MNKQVLTVDVGNTRVKWGLWVGDHIESSGDCVHNQQFTKQLFNDCLPQEKRIERVCLANVAGEKVETVLAGWVAANNIDDFFVLKTSKECAGVRNAYSDPSRHGVDRWAALLGARSLYDGEVCVICAGTAVTVDFMDTAGVHLGGVIMPGLEMMRQALIKDTAGIVTSDRTDSKRGNNIEPDILADNTEDAVAAGTLNLLRAGVQDVCTQAIDRQGENVTVLMTGGLAKKLKPLLKSSNIVYDPQLILKGLRLAADN